MTQKWSSIKIKMSLKLKKLHLRQYSLFFCLCLTEENCAKINGYVQDQKPVYDFDFHASQQLAAKY